MQGEGGEFQYWVQDQLLINLSTHQGWTWRLWYTLHSVRKRSARQLSEDETVAFLAVITLTLQRSSTQVCSCRPMSADRAPGHCIIYIYLTIYTRLSLAASGPFLLSACSCDPVATVIQEGWWGQGSRKSHPPKPHHLLHKCPAALPSGKHHLAHVLWHRPTSSHMMSSSLMSKKVMALGTAEVDGHVIHLIPPLGGIPLPCLGQSTENITTLYLKGNNVK